MPRQAVEGRAHARYANSTGPRFRGRGEWPAMTFNDVDDDGTRRACEIAQSLAATLTASMARDDCSMRQLARDSGIDVSTVKSVLDGSYMPRLDTAVWLLTARHSPRPFA